MAEGFTIGSFDLLAKDEALFGTDAAALLKESSVNDVSAVASLG